MTAAYEFAVVGAGLLGLASARELQRRHPDARIVVVDRAAAVASEQSGHNSGVIHAGVYYRPGSLKAKLCGAGAIRLYEYCAERGIQTRRVGKLIIATRRSELSGLDRIERMARSNGVPGLRRLEASEITQIEPHASGLAALHSPSSGIVDFAAVGRALAAEVQDAGAELRLDWPVTGISEASDVVVLHGPGGDGVEAKHAVLCAGLEADRLAVRAGGPADPRIVPFRGAYLRLRPEVRGLVRGLIYPVPDPALPFLGVHLTPQVDGHVVLGPTALMAGARDAYRLTRVRRRDLVDDFVLSATSRTIHVRNAPSPAATSSLALAELIVDRLQDRLR